MCHHATEKEKEEAMHLYTEKHQPLEELLFGIVKPTRIPTTFTVNGIQRAFREVPCRELGCPRCEQRRGGWAFRWVDARWTPKAALMMDRGKHLDSMQKPWPVGSRGTTEPVEDHA